MDLIVPDTIEPVVGWKALIVDSQGTLYSPQQTFCWNPQKRVEALCDNVTYAWVARKGGSLNERRPMPHRLQTRGLTTTATIITPIAPPWDVPEGIDTPQTVLPEGMHWSWEPTLHTPASNNSCGCGIYMVTDPTDAQPYMNDQTLLVQINGWGHVIQGTHGNRVQYAYPSLIITPQWLQERAEQAADLYKVPLQTWHPQLTQIDLSRTVRPTLNLARAAANLNQINQAAANAQTQIQQLNQTFGQFPAEPERSKASPFMPVAFIAAVGAIVNLAIGIVLKDDWFNWSFFMCGAVALISLFADFFVFNAQEKAAGR